VGRGRVNFVGVFYGFFVWAFEGLFVLVLGLWVLVGLEGGAFAEFPAGRLVSAVKVVFGGGLLAAEGVSVVCSLEQAYPQGTFLQAPLFLLRSFFYVQWEAKTKKLLKTLPQHQRGLLIHET